MKYEQLLEELSKENFSNEEVFEAAEEAMSFVMALHMMFKENGVDLPDEPDCSVLENLIDGLHGELAAASLFLSEDSFEKVPSMLKSIGDKIEKEDESFTDPQGETGVSVPTAIRKGFYRLAERIEATKKQNRMVSSADED